MSLEIYLSPVAEDWAKWQRVGKMPLHPMLSFLTNPAPIGCCPRKVKFHSVTDWRPKMWMNLPHGVEKRRSFQKAKADGTLALPSWSGFKDLEDRVVSLMEKSQNHIGKQPAYICKVCGKEGRQGNMKDHIEANHLEGIIIPCNLCDKTFRCRDSLRHHMRRHKSDL